MYDYAANSAGRFGKRGQGTMAQGRGMRNMTEGGCGKNILLFALPMLAGNVLQQAYNLVDSWVVGNYVGDGALAAVGIAFPVLFFFISRLPHQISHAYISCV